MAYVEVLEGFNKGKSFRLTTETFIGRTAGGWRAGDNPICIPDNRVSRRHARIVWQDSGFVIEDLNSTNGVVVRGQRIASRTPCALQDGDEIGIGSSRFRFHAEASDVQHQHTAPLMSQEAGIAAVGNGVLLSAEDAQALLQKGLAQDGAQPMVAAVLDAAVNQAQVAENELQSSRGLQEALKRLQAICQMSTALGAITDRETLLQKIINCVFEIFPGVERAFILLRQKGSDVLVPVVTKMRQETSEQQEEMPLSETIVREVLTRKHSIISFDALGDKRFSGKTSVIGLSIRSMMCAPLLVGDEILGLIQVDSRTSPRCFTTEDLQILTGISAQAAIAVKNMQLYETIEVETARRTSLQRYFSPRLVEMLMSGDLTTEQGGSSYKGIVLFADIIGFTTLSETMAPAEVMGLLNRYFTSMQKVIYENGGNVDKLSGDGIMAFWGGPYAACQDPTEAVLAALQMQRQLWFLNLDLATEGKQAIHVGMGLHTGEFIAGNVGSEDKIDFTLLGDTVNVAARIERLAGRYQVLVSETTWQAIKPLTYAVQLPPIKVKGKSAPITLYSIRGLRHKQHNGYTMALPCTVLDEKGRALGHGLLTGASLSRTECSLRLRTRVSLTRTAELRLRLTLPEYHQPLQCAARVLSKLPGRHGSTISHTNAVLTDIRGEDMCKLLTPGTSLSTAYTWDGLQRG